jgi:hypothetical protein
MSEPPPVAVSAGTVARAVFQTPVRLVSRTCCQSPGGYSSTGWSGSMMPALATTMSSLPKRSSTVPAAPVIASRSATSARMASAVPPAATICPAVCSSGPGRRPVTAARAPAPANATAMAAPMPVPPPVTRATFPFKLGIPTG